MKITSKGQVTIPLEVRERAGFLPETEVEFVISGDRVYIQKKKVKTRGRRIVAALRGKGDVKMTTDEIMALTRGE
ncbi:MAG TPA: AbrB/MazE/SpoVT family DNA-binding domain-containing protein [Planctomycetota bacterium]|nr:AbrB/MazE/SpoVT family DNA-binding domain-containing protein [Planctomycetota bacterium]